MMMCARKASSALAVALLLTFGATAANATPMIKKTAKVCQRATCKIAAQDDQWRLIKQNTVVNATRERSRIDIWANHLDARTSTRVGHWINSPAETATITTTRISGDFAAMAGTYETGVAQGTLVQLLDLNRAIRIRIEGPLAPIVDGMWLSTDGSVVIATTAGPLLSLDAYDIAGRRTLATGGFGNVGIGGNIVYWSAADGMHSALLSGPATNEQAALGLD